MAVIIFKPIEKCNSNCLYCGVIRKHQDVIMSLDLLETIFIRINDYLELYPEENIQLTWHGGEPCLLGVDYFNKALEYQERHCKSTKARIMHLMQSNLTVINQELIDVFKKLGMDRIGTSFEPIPNIRGFGPERDSRSYNKRFFDGTALLEKNGLSWGVIYVVHKRSLNIPKEIFHYLTNINLNSQPMFNHIYLYDGECRDLAITPEEYADFLGALLPLYWENRLLFPHLKPVSSFIESIQGVGGSACDYSGGCAYKWMYIGPKGRVSHCGRAGDFGFIDYGYIQDRTIDDVLTDKKRDIIFERQKILPENECKDCRFWGICHGGCPLDAYAAWGDFTKASPACRTVKRLVENYIEPITGLRVEQPPDARYRS